MSNKQSIIDKLEEIYNSTGKDGKQTGKNFVSHLIRAYLPTGKVQNAVSSDGKKMRCSITGRQLFSIKDIESTLNSSEFMTEFKKEILYTLNPENNNKGPEHPIKKFISGKQLGITGNKTNTFMCIEAYEVFTDWVFDKILKGDKHLEWVIRDMGNKTLIKHLNGLLPKPEKKEGDRNKKHKKTSIMYVSCSAAPKTTLGDFSALQELKKKFEAGS